MFFIGAHLSSAKGYLNMGKDALKIGANTFQFFTRNPRGFKSKPLNEEDLAGLSRLMQEEHFSPVVAHAPYTLNPCSTRPEVCELALQIFREDLKIMEYLPGNYYNFHPGSHLIQGPKEAAAKIADMLNQVLSPDQHTIVLLETMAGKGTEVGRTFEELAMILEQVELSEKMGVCFDSCHLSDAGYDVREHLDQVLSEFDQVIGLNRLKAFHLNDSLNPLGSHKDRHALIGEGFLGLSALTNMINHPLLDGLPFILETPTDMEGHKKEIELLKKHYHESEAHENGSDNQ